MPPDNDINNNLCDSEDMYDILRDSLIGRLCDKETIIRAYAVVALSKLVGSEDPNEAEQGEKTIQEVLLEVMCCDPAAYVPLSH